MELLTEACFIYKNKDFYHKCQTWWIKRIPYHVFITCLTLRKYRLLMEVIKLHLKRFWNSRTCMEEECMLCVWEHLYVTWWPLSSRPFNRYIQFMFYVFCTFRYTPIYTGKYTQTQNVRFKDSIRLNATNSMHSLPCLCMVNTNCRHVAAQASYLPALETSIWNQYQLNIEFSSIPLCSRD